MWRRAAQSISGPQFCGSFEISSRFTPARIEKAEVWWSAHVVKCPKLLDSSHHITSYHIHQTSQGSRNKNLSSRATFNPPVLQLSCTLKYILCIPKFWWTPSFSWLYIYIQWCHHHIPKFFLTIADYILFLYPMISWLSPYDIPWYPMLSHP